ncbi:cytochrome P450 [Ilumatobacter sp.]|uniref:cytochrome P450 n=1 Tax=Ilumatobacter sp. TaxID=1967498 RepID=UPI003C55A530
MSDSLPGPRGIANLRWTIRLARDVYGTLPKLLDEYGEVCALGIGRFRAINVFGPTGTREVFAQGAGTVSWHDAMEPLIPVDGETAIVVSDGADHARRRAVVQPAFGRRKLDDTIEMMSSEARSTFASWTPGTDHEASSELRVCIRRIVMSALFGDDMGNRADEFGDRLEDAFHYINRPPWKRFDHEWPGTPYRAAMKSRRAADKIVYDEIERRRTMVDLADRVDLLSSLLVARDDEQLTDVELRDQIVSLIAAGYDTTTAAASWMVHFLATNPTVWTELQREVHEIANSSNDSETNCTMIDGDMLARMPWLNGVTSETLRLGSPGYIAGRRIEAEFDVLGHTLPPGPFVFYCPYVTHRMASLWPDPLEFRPGRWIEGHEHHHHVAQGAWIPFGGGARRCLGLAFATTELKVLALELARAVPGPLVPERTEIAPTGFASMRPTDGVHIHVK